MCRQSSRLLLSVEETLSAEKNLLIYCKPVRLYNILHRRAQENPSFLQRCLKYRLETTRKRKAKAGIVIFNYRDCTNVLQKTEVTADFSCPFCSVQCASFKGMRSHLCSSHDLFNFDFWVTEEYQTVNVSVKVDALRSETLTNSVEPRLQTFSFCLKRRKRKPKHLTHTMKRSSVQFLAMDSPNVAGESIGEKASESLPNGKDVQNGWHVAENCVSYRTNTMERVECLASSSSNPGVSVSITQTSVDHKFVKTEYGSNPSLPPAKIRKLSADRSDSKNRVLLLKRQFFHSHRIQPMELEQTLSDWDSESEVDNRIPELEDRRMLDDFVDVSKDEKRLMHLWNSFVRKQRVLADGHVPWACEGFSKMHEKELVTSSTLFWCWKLFMIKLWNHGLLDASTMNKCSLILEQYREDEEAPKSSKQVET